MSCVIEEIHDEPDLTAYDKGLGDLLLKGCDGDTKKFIGAVFSFLKRKTNFSKSESDPSKRILEAWNQVGLSPPLSSHGQ